MKLRVIAIGDLEVESQEIGVQLRNRMEDACQPIAIYNKAVWTHYGTRIRRNKNYQTNMRKMRVFAVIDLADMPLAEGVEVQKKVEAAVTPYLRAYGVSWAYFDCQIRRERGSTNGKAERLRMRTMEDGRIKIS